MSLGKFQKELEENPALLDQTLSALMSRIGSRKGQVPVILHSDGLEARSVPYSSPISYSAMDALAAQSRAANLNPVGVNIAGALTGPGAVAVGLPGAPGVATGVDRLAVYAAVIVDVALSQNVPPTPFSFNLAGTFESGEAYASGNFEMGWSSKPGLNEQMVIWIAEEINAGPRIRGGRLTTSDWPSGYLANGAPNSAAGDQLTLTVVSAPATMSFNVTVVTAQNRASEILFGILWHRLANSEGPAAPAGRLSTMRAKA